MRNVIFFLFFFPFSLQAQFYNGSQQEFGKNRVQYFEFDWRSQNYERFKLYYYRGEDDYAEYVAKAVQKELLQMEVELNFTVQEHFEILLFKSLTELRQTNVGLTSENNTSYGGKSQIVGSKLFLYYEEDHTQLNQQIREVIAEAIFRKLLFGDQWSDALISDDPNKHPIWFTKGFVDYLAVEWNADLEAQLKDGFLTGKFDDFSLLNPEESRLAGHAFWHYIAETYGKSQLLNLLFVTGNTGHIDRSLLYLLGSELKNLLPDFGNYYKVRFLSDIKWQEDITGKDELKNIKKTEKLTQFDCSENGDNIAYVLNREGKYKLILRQGENGKPRKIAVYEPRLPRIQDESFPTMTFHPSGQFLAYFMERKGLLYFCLYDLKEKSTLKKEMPSLEKVLSCDYAPDGKTIVLSGVKNGQTDLYLYRIAGNSLDQLTDDLWDDVDPTWTRNGEGILFASNRTENEPPKKNLIDLHNNTYDLFLFPLKDKDKNRLSFERITQTSEVNERQAIQLEKGNISYLSDANGLWNRWELKRDSVIAFVDTTIHYRPNNITFAVSNLNTGILQQKISSKGSIAHSLVFQNNQFRLLSAPINHSPKESNLVYFKQRQQQKQGPQEETESNQPDLSEMEPDSSKLDSAKQDFEVLVEGRYEKNKLVLYQSEDEFDNQNLLKVDPLAYEKALPQRYKLNFAKDFVSAKIDNSFLSQSYQIYSGPGSVYLNPTMSGLLRVSLSDVMEDYVIAGGIRIPTARNNSEFFVAMDLRNKRWDKQLLYYRRSYESFIEGGKEKVVTHEGQLNLVFPFSEVFSFRGSVFSRADLGHALATNPNTILRETNYNYQGGLKSALVFDNARQWNENCWTGSKVKIFGELLQSTSSKNLGMINLGFDARHSIPIRKEMIWVNRLAAGTSIGNQRLLYYMGGVDNWLLRPNVDFNPDIPVDPKGNFAYQTLATPMRGFVQNQRNGSSFFVFNSEIRVPLFKMFTKGAIKNEPLRSFQVIGFFDLGTAWTGFSPFSKENTFNEQIIENKPVTIIIENSREPIIAATGLGARTRIFGYFVRADLGWGIENFSIRKKPILFLSLTHDI